MGGLEARTEVARAAAAALYLAAVALLVLLQEVGLRLRREESRAWWAGNGRDLLNAVGFSAVAAALRVYGLPLPAAVVAGATLTLALFGVSVFMETQVRVLRPRLWALVIGLVISAPLLLFPGAALSGLSRVIAVLFPDGAT